MAIGIVQEETVDDAMRSVLTRLLAEGVEVSSKRGHNVEIQGAHLVITNPLSRLSRSLARGKWFSCLGELCWYLAGSESLSFIGHYIREYEKEAEGDRVHGAYGPRLRGERDQLRHVIDRLREGPGTRQAVVQIFSAEDLRDGCKSPPCTCVLQFMVREGAVTLVVYMRSNDAILGLPHDAFAFTMLQELVARSVGAGVGDYHHIAGSMHLYDAGRQQAKHFLDEGWHSTDAVMPPMPEGDPWSSIELLLKCEEAVRLRRDYSDSMQRLDPYWADLVRMLAFHRAKKESDVDQMRLLVNEMHCESYTRFLARFMRETS